MSFLGFSFRKAAVFFLGFGYVAKRFEDVNKNRFRFKGGTTSKSGPHHYKFEDSDAVNEALRTSDVVIISTPPDEKGCPAFLRYGQNLQGKHIIYLSATNVYGDHKGGVVTEISKCYPLTQKGKNRLLAEQQWFSLVDRTEAKDDQNDVTILRLAGIYGPDRSIFERLPKLTERVDAPLHLFSRIHVDDICHIIAKVIAIRRDKGSDEKSRMRSLGIFNCSDDHPAPTKDLIEYACDLLDRDYPPLVPLHEAAHGPMTKDFYRERKIVSNQKIKEKLLINLKYPSFHDGLDALYVQFRQSQKES